MLSTYLTAHLIPLLHHLLYGDVAHGRGILLHRSLVEQWLPGGRLCRSRGEVCTRLVRIYGYHS